MSVVSIVREGGGENVISTNDNDIILDSEEDNHNDQQPEEKMRTVTTSKVASKNSDKKKKAKGTFHKSWLLNIDYSSWLEEVKHDVTIARCKACLKTFSIHNGGKTDVNKHMSSKLHSTNMKSFGSNALITSVMTPTSELDKVSAAEAAFVYHGVRHGHSYRSQQCTTNLTKSIFNTSSSIAKSIACGRTKSRAIVCNVLAPFFTENLINELLNARFYSLSFDASDKGACKTYPFTVQFFSIVGVKRGKMRRNVDQTFSQEKLVLDFYLGLISFLEDPHESADAIFKNEIAIIEEKGLKMENLTSIGADNANVNFGDHHSVYSLFKERLPHLKKGNCFSHVLHNSVKHGHDELTIDIEAVLCKLYSHFSRTAKRTNELKGYFDFVEADYLVLLKHINLRWLSLLRSIERLLLVYEPIKLYFMDQELTKSLTMTKPFFESLDGLCVLHFLHNILDDIQRSEMQLQRYYTTVIDLHRIVMNLIHNLNQRLTNQFFGMNTRQVLKEIKAIDEQKAIVLIQSFNLFIKTVINYIESYYTKDKAYYETLSCFHLQSNGFLTWENVLDVVDLISIPDLDIDKLYNEYCDLKIFYEHIIQTDGKLKEQVNTFIAKQHEHINSSASSMMSETEDDTSDDENMTHKSRQTSDTHIRSDQLWAYLLNVNGNTTPNMTKIVSYLFSIPSSNAFVESIFSKMKHSWTDYRNKMDIGLVAAELKLRTNCEYNCSYFHDYILSQPVLLRKIRTNEKYEQKKQRVREN